MTCRGLWVSHICSEMQCFFLFLNELTLNPISPHILKQRLFLFHELCSSQGLDVYSSTWNSSQFYSVLVSKRKEDAKEESKSLPWVWRPGWCVLLCGGTKSIWNNSQRLCKVQSSCYIFSFHSQLSTFLPPESFPYEMKGSWSEWGVWASNISFWCLVRGIHQKMEVGFPSETLLANWFEKSSEA